MGTSHQKRWEGWTRIVQKGAELGNAAKGYGRALSGKPDTIPCPNCGRSGPDSARFCPHCGYQF
ncbi:zinc-ribbon domain-containing protein [Streptomyces sp. NBC_00069]|uniref:zinc-ribbon domain-containing protein n=1 Tax=Streptomyces sp. NBC_00069 TaxID=2975639 RepID=UPI0038645014